MNNRFIGIGIALAVIVILIFVAYGTRKEGGTGGFLEVNSVKDFISDGKLDEAKEKIDAISETNADSGALGKAYFNLAEAYEKRGDLVKARDAYGLILNNYQNIDNILEAQKRLSELNMEILFSRIITDTDVLYEVEPGDSLLKISKKFGTTVELIKASNGLENDMIMANSKLKVSKARYKMLIDKSQNRLTLLAGDNQFVKVYRVSTGENNSTPLGTFKIVNRIEDPVWYTQGAVVPAESPDNILGSRWLGLSEPGYGIHGTTNPDSVGTQATKGCVRMLNHDVEELYAIVPVGTEITIVD